MELRDSPRRAVPAFWPGESRALAAELPVPRVGTRVVDNSASDGAG
jgi:hypothetical protein